jgi:hypothetical protein
VKVRRVKRSQSALALPRVEAVPFLGISPLVTLEDPKARLDRARNAFARLKPPEDHPSDQTAVWRDSVAAIALAVRVVAQPKRLGVVRAEKREPGGDIRREATELAAATKNPEVTKLVESILSEVERA